MRDDLEYQAWMAAQESAWESKCSCCGACCGAMEDPCENLLKQPNGRYYCGVYSHRFGVWQTVSGQPLTCVPIRVKLAQGHSWPGGAHCGYKKT